MPGRKQAKQTPFSEDYGSGNISRDIKRSKPDTKLLTKETDEHTRPRAGKQINVFENSSL